MSRFSAAVSTRRFAPLAFGLLLCGCASGLPVGGEIDFGKLPTPAAAVAKAGEETNVATVRPAATDPIAGDDGDTESVRFEVDESDAAPAPPAEHSVIGTQYSVPGTQPSPPELSLLEPSAATDADADDSAANAYSLRFDDVLYLADSNNPQVAIARERIRESYARVARAKAMWLPSLRAGVNYNHHEGTIQDVAGRVFETTRSSLYGGFGAAMVGAGSPAVPGLVAQFHLSDAIHQPRIAAHQAAAREFGSLAARNDVLRDAAVQYLELVRAEHALAIADEAVQNTQKLAELTRKYAESGQGLLADQQRLEAELAVRQDQLAAREEAVRVAAARLAEVLRADPTVAIVSGEPAVVPLDLLPLDDSLAGYVALGLSRRPELCEQQHLVREAVERLRRERHAPLLPSVLLGLSYGGMGGGFGGEITNSGDRWDADAVAFWELRNLGLGDRAVRGEIASQARQAEIREAALLDRVAREVTETHAQVLQRRKRINLAESGIAAAEQSYTLNQQRIENAQGLPIEVLQAVQALATARLGYLNAVIDYNVAQVEFCRATGWFAEAIEPESS